MTYLSAPGIISGKQKSHTPGEIIETVSNYFNIPVEHMKCTLRDRKYYYPRIIAMHFIKTKTDKSLGEIARIFNRADHTTVIHSLKTVKDLEYSDKEFKKQVTELSYLLK